MSNDPYYRSADWKRLRAAVLARDPMCRAKDDGRAEASLIALYCSSIMEARP